MGPAKARQTAPTMDSETALHLDLHLDRPSDRRKVPEMEATMAPPTARPSGPQRESPRGLQSVPPKGILMELVKERRTVTSMAQRWAQSTGPEKG